MKASNDPLVVALRDAGALVDASSRRFEDVIVRAREANLLGTLAARLDERRSLDRVAQAPRAHLVAARVQALAQQIAVRREVGQVANALRPLAVPVVLLKGAAYVLAGLPPANGRFFSDVDILVPKCALLDVESALMQSGFATAHHHPYDQRYYRQWIHELPPMQHVKRMTVLDVHHTIVPGIGRIRLDAAALFRSAIALPGESDLRILAPSDMVLHSATHLFHNEDWTHALRDLVDLDALLRHFGALPGFWRSIVPRAEMLDLARPLYYALRWTTRLFDTPIPPEISDAAANHAPGSATAQFMDALLDAAIPPTAAHPATRWARRAMTVHGYWLKMRLPFLAWHLTVKALRREPQSA
jgi:hypothetical protein